MVVHNIFGKPMPLELGDTVRICSIMCDAVINYPVLFTLTLDMEDSSRFMTELDMYVGMNMDELVRYKDWTPFAMKQGRLGNKGRLFWTFYPDTHIWGHL